jgi:hypothetical protein
MLREILETKSQQVRGDWRQQHNEKLHDFYGSRIVITVIKSWRMRRLGYLARVVQKTRIPKYGLESCSKQSERPRCRWEDNINTDLKQVEW